MQGRKARGRFRRLVGSLPMGSETIEGINPAKVFDDGALMTGGQLQWIDKPPIKNKHAMQAIMNDPTFTNYTGLVIGSLVVIGLLDEVKGSGRRSACWVVRCKCGEYTTRKSKQLAKRLEKERCHKCGHLEAMKHHFVSGQND